MAAPSTKSQESRLKELIAKGKEQGFLTYAEVNDHPVSYTHLRAHETLR